MVHLGTVFPMYLIPTVFSSASELLVLFQLFVLEQTYLLWLIKGKSLSLFPSILQWPAICLALETKMTGAAKNTENCPEHLLLIPHLRFVMENLPCLAVKISSLWRCLVLEAAFSTHRSCPFWRSWRVQAMVRRRQGPLHSCHLLIQAFMVLTGKL